MRIVIDLQAAQSSGSRNRGIGRYSMALALAMARNRGEHEVIIALSGLFPDTIEPIREQFSDLLPRQNIRVWHAVAPVSSLDSVNDWRRKSAELVREAFLASLKPDVVHISSLFEGLVDDAVTSIGAFSGSVPTAVTLYDLIPYIHRSPYLENPAVEAWYLGKLEHLRRADLWLAISESSKHEGKVHLGLPEKSSINISTDADSHFKPLRVSPVDEVSIRKKYGLTQPFVMYTGGIDHRKNIEGLIRAFSMLPKALRETHQLAIVCSAQKGDRDTLEHLATQRGVGAGRIVVTGFVPEADLVALYNLCALFVFPSWHEGFGLPALEAMRCGAPVIGANTSSLPEVIGWEEALFDPHSDDDMATKIGHALSDEAFRGNLIRRGIEHSKKFSWDVSARRAISAMEHLLADRNASADFRDAGERRLRLAYLSPLPPERTGIADYSLELLPELARLYDIDVVVDQVNVSDGALNATYSVCSVQAFLENYSDYDRVLYHFGNSPFHQHMFDLIKVIPGVVVLHDFFLSNVLAHIAFLKASPALWVQELYKGHGYPAVCEHFHANNDSDVVWKYPCSLGVIQDALGVIVHSANSVRLAEHWYGSDSSEFAALPLLRVAPSENDSAVARRALGFGSEDFLVCAFGMLGPTKLNLRLLDAWLKSKLAENSNCYLVFVGENHPGEYGIELLSAMRRSGAGKNIRITGWVSGDVYRQYLAAADVGVQLRTFSRGETSAAVLDCMNYGLATIVNANGSMADLGDEPVWMLPDEFADEQLIDALEVLWQDEGRRLRLGRVGEAVIRESHNPLVCAEMYRDAIERFYKSGASSFASLPTEIAGLDDASRNDPVLAQLAEAIIRGFPLPSSQRQLLVDVSTIVHGDSRTGIQRVVRSILAEWLKTPPAGLRVEPVYATPDRLGYRYARKFTLGFLGCPADSFEDEPIEYACGDVFFGLDLQHYVVTSQQNSYRQMRRQGVCVKFMVYDLLPVLLPDVFMPGIDELHEEWLKVIVESDGLICISRSVASELLDWVRTNAPDRASHLDIESFHLGADVENSRPSIGIPPDGVSVLEAIQGKISFLMVGTIEPRKGHAQALDAFEILWQLGHDVQLVIVGKQGWKVDAFVERVRSHDEIGRRLFWLDGISDEYLERTYGACSCLIAASYGEGFGLPLIEAAQHKLSIIARDLPVFREVAENNAFYFDGGSADDLASAIARWVDLYHDEKHPLAENMSWMTWKESAEQLMCAILKAPKPVAVAHS